MAPPPNVDPHGVDATEGPSVTPAPAASILMAMHNGERYVVRAIESVRTQSLQDWELIVVDDASTDDSVALVDSLRRGDNRIRLFELERNSGSPARPRNVGLREARGDVCFLLDQDDAWEPEKLAKQLRKLESGPFGLVYSDCHVRREGLADALYSELWGPMAQGDVAADLLARCFVPALTAGIPRHVLEDVGGFDESLAGVDDYDCWLKIVGAGHAVAFVDEPLATWHLTESSLTRHRRQHLEHARSCLRSHRATQAAHRAVIDEHRERLRKELLALRLAEPREVPSWAWFGLTATLVRTPAELRMLLGGVKNRVKAAAGRRLDASRVGHEGGPGD